MGCAGNQCCFSVEDEISICEHILGDAYTNEDTSNMQECLVGQFSTNEPLCVGIGHGCNYTRDDPAAIVSSTDFTFGRGYLRPRLNSSQFRDAKNRIADVRSWRGSKENIGTFLERLELESASCVDNLSDLACWGVEQGHPCACFTNMQSVCPVPPQSPFPPSVIGKNPVTYIHDGWPMDQDTAGATGNTGANHPLRWDEDPSIGVTLRDTKRGQTKFVSTGGGAANNFATNALIQCHAFVPDGSPCFDCAGIRHCDESGCQRNQAHYFGDTSHPFANLFKEIEFVGWNPTLRGDSPEVELYNEVLATIENEEFPVACGFPGQVTRFDRLDDHIGSVGNIGLGFYSRGWTAQRETFDDNGNCIPVADIEHGVKVKDLEGVKTKWGGCPVEAELVIVDVQVWAHVHLHKSTGDFRNFRRDVWPFAVFSVIVKLGVRVTIVPDCEAPNTGCPGEDVPCMVGDEEVMAYYPPGSMFPMVTPSGNEIDYGQRIRSVVEWRGRLSNLSTPKVQSRNYYQFVPGGNSTGGTDCDFIRDRLDDEPITIPPLPGDAEGDEPNNWYTGDVKIKFHGG